MKATQLRLGNYLQGKNTVVKVTRIFNEDEIGIGSGDPYTVSGETPCLLPIPLTEEWLLKCGFVEFEIDEISAFIKDEFIFEFSGVLGFYKYGELEAICIHENRCKYLHQLQNLFWILCGEELEINL